MEIRNCPECAAETVSAGLALWDDAETPVLVFECIEPDCGWAGVEAEWSTTFVRSARDRSIAA
ncbi:hypothetical protein OH146_00285 [Salinibacterium sp. SYSU T00001]|uniref:hypothetical protein n=1 Tax=Homoserinimonas sedimenticola TaxID=2986805 RepID=UPI0022359055|nr:hypothetical protein [Salinibacterium sedimenticola]MCW4384208.1 hypothetical protein [Salinibacterium sedimenticola]